MSYFNVKRTKQSHLELGHATMLVDHLSNLQTLWPSERWKRAHMFGPPQFLSLDSSTILLKIICVTLTWIFLLPLFLLFLDLKIPWMFWTCIFLDLTFSLTNLSISSTLSSRSEILSPMSYNLLVRIISEVFAWSPKFFISSFISDWIFFSDSVSTLKKFLKMFLLFHSTEFIPL